MEELPISDVRTGQISFLPRLKLSHITNTLYSQLSLDGHLYNMKASLQQTPVVGLCHFAVILYSL